MRVRFRTGRGRKAIPTETRRASPALAGTALLTQGVASLCVAMTERNRYWRAGAALSGCSSLASAFMVFVFHGRRWLRWPVGSSLVAALAVVFRLDSRAAGAGKRRRR